MARAHVLPLVSLALLGCSPSTPGARPQGAGASESGGSGGAGTAGQGAAGAGSSIVVIDAGVAGNDAGPAVDDWPTDLPPPWPDDDGQGKAVIDSSLPDDVGSRFGGPASTTNVPELIYPLARSMHPRNLLDVTFQWRPLGHTVFRIEARAPDQTYRFYASCTTPECRFSMPKSEWFDLGRRYPGVELSFVLSGTDGLGGPVATAAPVPIWFSDENVIGALYYWSSGTSELKRATFGSAHAVPFITPRSATSDFPCVSCHSVSRDGRVIAFAVSEDGGHHGSAIQVAPTDDPEHPYVKPVEGDSPWAGLAANYEGWATETADVPPRYLGPTAHLGNMVSLNSDGTLAAVNGFLEKGANREFRFFFEIRDARTGATLSQRDYAYLAGAGASSAVPIMPEWSPDGRSIAVTLADNGVAEGCIWAWNTCRGSIGIFSVENGRLTGEPRVVVAYDEASSIGHFYPTWSPDGRFLAFASGPGESFNNTETVLRLVRSDGGPHPCPGASCWELGRATRYTREQAASVQGHSTWPKFTPFAQRDDRSLLFVSFTSRLPYGFHAQGNSQLWMFALDTRELGPGADPSFSPIWLPYQELEDLSLTPYWAEALPCQSDTSGGCRGCRAGESCKVDTANHCECVASVVR